MTQFLCDKYDLCNKYTALFANIAELCKYFLYFR
jgi:hypothetical protein